MATATTPTFEPLRNEDGTVYKLRGKLSKNKTADIAMVPKTKMAYLHLNDYTNAWKDGRFDKNCSKIVSLSMKESSVLRQLMSTMDGQVQALINSTTSVGKKRKRENIQQVPAYYTTGQQSSAPTATANDQQVTSAYQQIPASYAQLNSASYYQQTSAPLATANDEQTVGAYQQIPSAYGQHNSVSYQQMPASQ